MADHCVNVYNAVVDDAYFLTISFDRLCLELSLPHYADSDPSLQPMCLPAQIDPLSSIHQITS